MVNALVTGAFGLVGTELVAQLQSTYGIDQVIAVGHSHIPETFDGLSEKADVRDDAVLTALIEKYQPQVVYHLAGLLSVGGEKTPDIAWDVNANGLKLILDLAVKYKFRLFWPSSIAAFGATTPRDNTPQHTVIEPTTMYGVTKVAGELLCQYYHHRYGVDVRSLRYPGLNGYKADPGDGTTEYAIHIFYAALRQQTYVCPLKPDTMLPMMYMDDAITGTIQLMSADESNLSVRTSYNFSGISFTPAQLAAEIQKIQPEFTIEYQPDARQAIADSWPKTIDDSAALSDWGWRPQFDLNKMTRALYDGVQEKLRKAA